MRDRHLVREAEKEWERQQGLSRKEKNLKKAQEISFFLFFSFVITVYSILPDYSVHTLSNKRPCPITWETAAIKGKNVITDTRPCHRKQLILA